MKYLLCYILLVKTLEKSIRNKFKEHGNTSRSSERNEKRRAYRQVTFLSLVQSGVLSIPGNPSMTFAVPAVSGQYNVKQYLARLCI